MKKIILGLSLATILCGTSLAQSTNTRASSTVVNETSASKNGNVVLQSGTQISGQLQNSLDAKNTRVGDQVVLKTTQTIKQNGRVVVNKGSRLVGRVTEVQQRTQNNATSKIGVLFDRLENGKMTLPINAVITSVTQARGSVSATDDTLDTDVYGSSSTSGSTRSRGSSSSSGGGLLGGVTNTVGGVVNTTGQTAGGVTNTVGQTVGSTTQTVGKTVRGIQISQSGSASADAGSTLSLTGGNLRLEKGTTLNLRLIESASIGNN